mgnify:FL=1
MAQRGRPRKDPTVTRSLCLRHDQMKALEIMSSVTGKSLNACIIDLIRERIDHGNDTDIQ